ncbi:ATP-binding protein [Qiania dongpingensis]|uniref:AAA family ATPase n=1 Tax=Qiania dongpingensis TaxID=2763669 RepID=A0A7G9G0K6_9FIRM|nr:AAA family ATPase [Qiania dongpingensis]QNM04338.1 AAA family ATPase [Qiania dongpingensis]
MILKDIHISSFGKYTHQDMSFDEGINVIYGDNESGKSTLHAYLKSMLFGMERGRGKAAWNDAYSHYYPWNSQASYGGSLSFSAGDGEYLIERCLDTKNRSLSLKYQDSGRVIGTEQSDVDALLGHITEETYRNTISIEQLRAATDGTLSAQLKNHLSSIALSGTSTLDVTKTLASLKEKKRILKQQLDPSASSHYQALFQEICEAEDKLKAMDGQPEELENQIKDLEAKLAEEKQRQAELNKSMEEKRNAVESHSLAHIKDPDIYQERIQDAFTAYRLAAEETAKHARRALRLRDIISGTISFFIFLLLGLGTLFYEDLPFTGTPFPFPKLPFLILFFAATGISFLLTIILFVRSKKDDSDSEAMAAETEQFLRNEFTAHLHTSEISEENMKAMEEKMAEYTAIQKALSEEYVQSEESLKATVALQEKLQNAHGEMARCQKEAWEFEQACKHLTELEEQKSALEKTIQKNKEIQEKIEAIGLAEETISSLSSKIHESFSPVLNSKVSEILCAITDGVYERLYIDENLSVTLRSGGRTIPLESLSRGTIEQVYLALRISAVEILYPDLSLPILLDDTFAYYDDSRLHNTLKWLAENYPGQVLLFTCHKREAAYLSRLNVPYHLLALS